MTAITFDTLTLSETLQDCGFDEKQARGLVCAFREVQSDHANQLASQLTTKPDVTRLEMHLLELKREFQRDLKELEYRMTIGLGSLVIASAGFVVAVLRYAPPLH